MRIWDLPVEKLCDRHLLGEHAELHAAWSILTKKKKGYAHHPETLRWRGKLKALYRRHQQQVGELRRRGYKHLSPLAKKLAVGKGDQEHLLDSLFDQKQLLKAKRCSCLC